MCCSSPDRIYARYPVAHVSGEGWEWGCVTDALTPSRYCMYHFCTDFMIASIGMLINSGLGLGSTLYAVNNVDPQTSILAFCKLRIYISQFGAMVYRWCLVAASLDRYALSSTNARFRQLATVKTARRTVAIIVSVWVVLPVHTFIFYNLNAGTCGIVFSFPVALYHSIYTTIAGTVLPIAFMLRVCPAHSP